MPTAIITGAASGLGQAFALRLAQDRWKLALVDINVDDCEATRRQVEAAGGKAHVVEMDVSQPAAWDELKQRLQRDWPQLDLLVNSAGVCGAGEVGEFPLTDWQWLLATNLNGVVYGCHTMVDWLKANPAGAHIMNVASLAGFASPPAMAAYNVSKAGVMALSETLRVELAGQGVGVTVVCPGFVRTGLLQGGRFAQPRLRELAEAYTDMSRLTAAEVAAAAVRAYQRKRLYSIEGLRARSVWRFKRFFPRLFLTLLAWTYHSRLNPAPKR